MAEPARHRFPRPTRLLVVITSLLMAGGVAVATGSASADGVGRGGLAYAAEGRDTGSKDGKAGRDGSRNRAGGGNNKDNNTDNNNKDNNNKDNNKKDNNKKDNNKKDNNKKDNKNKDAVEFPGRDKAGKASDDDFVDIRQVDIDNELTRRRTGPSTGSFVLRCGTNKNRHNNSDNFMVTPGKRNGAQHKHDYVGNLSTDAFSTDDSLHAAGTTCEKDNKSTFFWPVLRDTRGADADVNADGGGKDGNFGRILSPASVDLRFLGNPRSTVIQMPEDLTILTGDAKAVTNGPKNANAKWSCTGFENRITDKYPLCPAGSKIMRILDFPSCWDGENLDSKDHRTHTAFPNNDGSCADGFKTIPLLRETLTYDAPPGRNFALDSFPDQQHNPGTDHGDFMNIAPDALMKAAAGCINSGRSC